MRRLRQSVELVEARLQLAERQEPRSLDPGARVLGGLAHIEQQQLLAARARRLELGNARLAQAPASCSGRHSAESLVVDQLGQGRLLSAGGALGVLLDPELAELHAERVDLEQPARSKTRRFRSGA